MKCICSKSVFQYSLLTESWHKRIGIEVLVVRHIISILIENESGALSRVAGLFSARGYNIESLTVAVTEDASLSRMTIVTSGTENIIEQINKQLNKLIDVVKIADITEGSHIERELMMVKVDAAKPADRDELQRLADIFKGRIIDVSDNIYTVELTGEGEKLDSFLEAVDEKSIIETVRSGAIGIARGKKSLQV